MNKEQRITGNITPPNKDLGALKKHFPQCFDKSGNLDFEKFKKQLSKTEINFSKESYGMDWLGKSYARLLATDETTTLLKEDETFNQKPENANSENLLIKGDNLEVLKHLSNAYYEKIKMIYIDPPYNTGSDGFVYADDRKFTKDQLQELAGISEERAKRILDFTQSKSNSHSAWLTFMYPRLYIAKQLLKDDGVIFISIDDNEVAQLKLLLDEIFGEENFVAQFSWQKKTGASDAVGIATITEHILTFSNNKDLADETFTKNYDSFDTKRYKLTDKHSTKRGNHYIDNLDRGGLNYSDSMNYGIECPDGTLTFPNGRREYLNDGWIWKWSKKKVEWGIKNEFIEIKKSKSKANGWAIYYKNYLFVDNENKKIKRSAAHKNLILNVLNTKGTNEIKSYFNKKIIFNNSKPSELLKKFISYTKLDKEDIILDFFAGSGTTADAVMQLNAEDRAKGQAGGGNRKFILVQLPEKIDPKKNKTAYDFVKQLQEERRIIINDKLLMVNEDKKQTKQELIINHSSLTINQEPTIFEITKERLIRASKKIQEENKDKDLSKLDLGFKIFETMPIWEDYNFEADELDEQQMLLFDESKLTKEDIKALLITWKTYDGVPLTESLQEINLGETQINNSPLTINNYTAHYSNGKLYLMNKGFKTKNLKTLLEKIDSDKDFNPTTIIAFGYHFESKNLREISENMKSYANKKNIDIDFITRY